MAGPWTLDFRWMAALVLGAASALCSIASAQDVMPGEGEIAAEDQARARTLFDEGEAAFATGDYALALARFEEAYRLSQRPELLYNIAFCQERLGNDEAALSGYELFLSAVPDAPNRADVERRISVERERVARASAAARAAGTDGASRRERTPFDPGPAILGLGSAAVVAAGVILVAVGATQRNALAVSEDGRREWTDVERELGVADTLVGVGAGAMGLGVVGAAVAIGWAMSNGGTSEEGTPSAGEVRADVTAGGVLVSGWF